MVRFWFLFATGTGGGFVRTHEPPLRTGLLCTCKWHIMCIEGWFTSKCLLRIVCHSHKADQDCYLLSPSRWAAKHAMRLRVPRQWPSTPVASRLLTLWRLSSKHPCQLTGCWAQWVDVVEWEWSYERRRGRQAQGWEGGSKRQWPRTGVVLDCARWAQRVGVLEYSISTISVRFKWPLEDCHSSQQIVYVYWLNLIFTILNFHIFKDY